METGDINEKIKKRKITNIKKRKRKSRSWRVKTPTNEKILKGGDTFNSKILKEKEKGRK